MTSPLGFILPVIERLANSLETAGRLVLLALIGWWALIVIMDKLGIYDRFDNFMSSTRLAKRREYLDFRERYFEEQRQRREEYRQLREQLREERFRRAWDKYQSVKEARIATAKAAKFVASTIDAHIKGRRTK